MIEQLYEDEEEYEEEEEKSRKKSKKKKRKASKMEIKTFVNFPELPNVRTYGEWKMNIIKIIAGISNKPDSAVK